MSGFGADFEASASAGLSLSASVSASAGGPAKSAGDEDFLTSFNFEVHLTVSGLGGDEGLIADPRGAFAEVSGLEYELETTEVREGGYNLGVRRLVGRTSHPTLVLKRGLTVDAAFWEWIQRCTDGTFPLPYVSGEILQFPAAVQRDEAAAARWAFTNGIVTKVKSADLSAAAASSVPLEELHVAHEGLRRLQ